MTDQCEVFITPFVFILNSVSEYIIKYSVETELFARLDHNQPSVDLKTKYFKQKRGNQELIVIFYKWYKSAIITFLGSRTIFWRNPDML